MNYLPVEQTFYLYQWWMVWSNVIKYRVIGA